MPQEQWTRASPYWGCISVFIPRDSREGVQPPETDRLRRSSEGGGGRVMNIIGEVEKRFGQVNSTVFRQVNRVTDWWNLPTPVALLNLRGLRDDLRTSNLHDTNAPPERQARPRPRRAAEAPHLRRLAPGPDRSRDGPGRHPFRPQHAERRPPRGAARAARPEPPRGLRAAAPPRHLQAGRDPQRARRVLDPVREPRLVRPRRELPRRVHRGAAARRRRLAGRQPDEGEGDQPRPNPHEQERAAADLRQHGHPLVGRLADLRLRRGAQPRAPLGRRRQAEGGRATCSRRRPRRSSRAST